MQYYIITYDRRINSENNTLPSSSFSCILADGRFLLAFLPNLFWYKTFGISGPGFCKPDAFLDTQQSMQQYIKAALRSKFNEWSESLDERPHHREAFSRGQMHRNTRLRQRPANRTRLSGEQPPPFTKGLTPKPKTIDIKCARPTVEGMIYHTHNRFMVLLDFVRTTWVSQHQKGKTRKILSLRNPRDVMFARFSPLNCRVTLKLGLGSLKVIKSATIR